MKIRFGHCALDLEARTLLCDGDEVHLAPKQFHLLKVLLENRPRALSKAELIQMVWPGVFVADDSLAKVMSQLRKAINDDDETPIVKTVHGYGYAFTARVDDDSIRRSAAPHPVCWIFSGNREFPLSNGEHLIGREPDATICLDSPKVSRRHAKLTVSGSSATLEDLGSKNGSFVGGVRIVAPTILRSGDEATIGPFTLVFRVAPESGSTQTETV